MDKTAQEELRKALEKTGVTVSPQFTGKLEIHYSQGAVQVFEKHEKIKPTPG